MKTLLFLVAVMQLSTAAPWFTWNVFSETPITEKPDFCREYECPEYRVIQGFNGYELREYSPSVWSSTRVSNLTADYWEDKYSTKEAFMKLFHYIQGGNDRNETMDMTVPVVSSHAKDEVWMNFMVPANMSDNPPQPTNTDVEIYRAAKDEYFVRPFTTWILSDLIYGDQLFAMEFNKLKADLDRDGQSYTVDPMFFTAVYNGPWKIFNRYNEIWIMKK